MRLNAHELADATGGVWSGPPPDAGFAVRSVSTDTRLLQPGDLFVALRGETFDGHACLQQAAAAGACACVCRTGTRAPGFPLPVLLVPDTLHALGDIAIAWREQCPAHRVAVVGSSGKTTTKEMLALILREAGGDGDPDRRVLATAGNFNNRIGLPLTLFRLHGEHRWAVLELGMNEPGELGRLTKIAAPQLLVLLQVGTAHVGKFGSREQLVAAKAEAVRALGETTPLLYDAGSDNTRSIVRQWGDDRPTLSFGVDRPADFSARNIHPLGPDGYAFEIDFSGQTCPVRVPCHGRHNVTNALAAAAAAHILGLPPPAICQALAAFRPPAMRSETRCRGGVSLVVDCYNANPESMQAALESLTDWQPRPARIFLVLGEMLELGAESPASHARLAGQALAGAPDAVLAVGEAMRAFADAWEGPPGLLRIFPSSREAGEALAAEVRPGDLVLFKGSRACRLEQAVEILERALDARADPAP